MLVLPAYDSEMQKDCSCMQELTELVRKMCFVMDKGCMGNGSC